VYESQKEFQDKADANGGDSSTDGKDVIHTDDHTAAPLDSKLVSSVTLQAILVSSNDVVFCHTYRIAAVFCSLIPSFLVSCSLPHVLSCPLLLFSSRFSLDFFSSSPFILFGCSSLSALISLLTSFFSSSPRMPSSIIYISHLLVASRHLLGRLLSPYPFLRVALFFPLSARLALLYTLSALFSRTFSLSDFHFSFSVS
jgi:hypothetical protein